MCDLCGNNPHEYNCECGGVLMTVGMHYTTREDPTDVCCDQLECSKCEFRITECSWRRRKQRVIKS